MLPSVARSSVRRSPSARRASLAKATGIRTARLFPHLETCVSLGIRICNEMRWWLLITAIAAVVARAEEFSVPSQLYIVSVFLSPDVSAFHYRDRVVDVKPAGPDSLIRYSRVATVNLNCPRIIVQSATGRVHNTSPGELVKANNPCAVKPGALNALLKRYPRAEGAVEFITFGIVAQCGSSSIVLGLPISEKVDMDLLQRENPKLARLWNLASEITDPVFGSNGHISRPHGGG